MVGFFIAFEGIDGAGLTTNAKLLSLWLRKKGFSVLLTKEPTNGPIGKLIRHYLKKDLSMPEVDALLFAADRAEHFKKVIAPALRDNKIVICDRYVESSIAYQSAEGLDEKWIEEINVCVPRPDLTIILDVDPSVALNRIENRVKTLGVSKEKFERIQFLRRVRSIYRKRAEEQKYVVIDATPPIKIVQESIRKIVWEKLSLKQAKNNPSNR